jgi:hypothetical protein
LGGQTGFEALYRLCIRVPVNLGPYRALSNNMLSETDGIVLERLISLGYRSRPPSVWQRALPTLFFRLRGRRRGRKTIQSAFQEFAY